VNELFGIPIDTLLVILGVGLAAMLGTLAILALRNRIPAICELGSSELSRETCPAMDCDPTHCPRKSVVPKKGAELPDPGVGLGRRIDSFFHKPSDQREKGIRVGVHNARVIQKRVETEHNFTHQVMLMLIHRGVSDAHVAVSAKARQVFQNLFRQITLAAYSIQGLKRPRLGNVSQV